VRLVSHRKSGPVKGRGTHGFTRTALVLLLFASGAAHAGWASAGTPPPTCAVSPSSGIPNAGVVLSGSKWKPRSSVNISFAQDGVATSLGTDSVNRRGRFSDSTSVPETAQPRTASFVVTGKGKDGKAHSCSAAFTVLSPPPPTAAWGVDAYSAPAGSIRTMEADMGRPFAAWATYRRIDDAGTYLQVVDAPVARGALAYLNINNYGIDPTTGTKVPYCWSNVSNGNEDSMIDAWAKAIIESGYMDRTIVTFNHEPNVNTSAQPKCSTDDATAYRAAFDYFYKRMRTDGVISRFAFVPTAKLYATSGIDSYLPPAGDFQLIGADIYNNSSDPTSTKYRTASQAFGPFYDWAATNEPGMPMIIGELGEYQNDPNAPQWISDALAYMESHGNLLFVNWNLQDTTAAYYSPLLRSDSYQVWLSGAADAYFGG